MVLKDDMNTNSLSPLIQKAGVACCIYLASHSHDIKFTSPLDEIYLALISEIITH